MNNDLDDKEIEMMLKYVPRYTEDNAKNIKDKFLQKSNIKQRKVSFKKWALVGTAASMLFTTTLAYQSNKQEELTKITTNWDSNDSMTPLNIVKEDGNYIFTAKSIIQDKRSAFMLFSIKDKNNNKIKLKEIKDGIVFGFDNIDVNLSNNDEYNTSLLCLEPSSEEEYEFILAVESVNLDSELDLSGESIDIEFKNFLRGNIDILGKDKGEWAFNIGVPEESTGQHYTLKESFPYGSGFGELTEVYISPLHMDLTLSGSISEDLSYRLFNETSKLSLELKNGEVIPQTSILKYINGITSISKEDSLIYTESTSSSEPTFSFLLWPYGHLDAEDFEAFYIDEIRIPLNLK